jgi:type IV secretion system protein VirB9
MFAKQRRSRSAAASQLRRAVWVALTIVASRAMAQAPSASIVPLSGDADNRIRIASYNPDQVYRLTGYVGYELDLEFEPGESFVGLGAGDLEGLSFVAQDNHLFLKPKAAKVETNLTVLTNRRHYHFDYTASLEYPDPAARNVIYSLRFHYPPTVVVASNTIAAKLDEPLDEAIAERPRNLDYWFCGDPALKPVAVSDDGVHTRLTFGARAELPAVFVRNDDGSESLLNFSVQLGDLVVHRVARQFVVRRGRLKGCILNRSFTGGGERLSSGTVSHAVERVTPGARP